MANSSAVEAQVSSPSLGSVIYSDVWRCYNGLVDGGVRKDADTLAKPLSRPCIVFQSIPRAIITMIATY